ncbi:hypothetical protein [Phenylobacterium sp.]|uniref:hypothetical protein n=1 Tax=Phenylobacterium sp. TaxID=1871053 RepID=UPI0030F4742E
MSGSLDRYFRRTTAEIAAARQRLEDQGRQVWNEATRSGQAAVGDTLTALRKLAPPEASPAPRRQTIAQPQTTKMMGRGYAPAPKAPNSAAMSPKRQTAAPTLATKPLGRGYVSAPVRPPAAPSSAGERAAAALHGFSDGATFGAGDQASALFHAGLPGDGHWSDRYNEQKRVLRAEDAYDQAHYPMTRTAGQVAGAVTTAFTPLGIEAGALKAASHFPKAARFVKGATATKRITPVARGLRDHARWSAIAAGAGGATGVSGQAVSDVASQRKGSLRSYAASAVGGAADSVGTIYLGPARGGALGGAVASAADDAFNGRIPSLASISAGAAAGSVVGKATGALGTFAVHTLPGLSNIKGLRKETVGDALSEMRSRLEGEGVFRTQRPVKLTKSHTRVDHITKTGRPVEAKFGFKAQLSPAQILAREELPNYRIDHFLAEDIGKLLALPLTGFSSGFQMGRRRE